MSAQDNDLVLCVYSTLSRGDHRVVGGVTGRNYGYRTPGDKFYVDKRDIAGQPDLFKPIQSGQDTLPKQEQPVAVTPPPAYIETQTPAVVAIHEEITAAPPAVAAEEHHDDLQTIPGVSAIHAQMLNAAGVHTYADLVAFGTENLKKFKGIADARAKDIIDYAGKKVRGEL